jgi:hypothetical protein
MPDIKYQTKDAIPEGLREYAKEADGGFVVSVVPKTKLDEFRENNINIARERDELQNKITSYESIVGEDVGQFKENLEVLKKTHQQVQDGKLKGNEAIEAEVNRRLTDVKTNYESQLREAGAKLQTLEHSRSDFETKFKRSLIDREITNAVLHPESGVNPAALPDILTRAYGLYNVTDDGKLVAKQGDAVVYGADGVTPMQPKEWLSKVLEASPYLGKQSTGGGAAGANGKQTYGGLAQSEFDKLPAQQRLALARSAGK